MPKYLASQTSVLRAASLTALILCAGCTTSEAPKGDKGATSNQVHVDAQNVSSVTLPSLTDQAPRDYSGIHNAVAFADGFVSGSLPEGEEGFDSLARMGIKTIISVDGAAPEVELAKLRGMKYIHLPIGYNGCTPERKMELIRASRDARLNGPVYIHCHHGKHRSAGAAGAVAASLGWATAPEGVARMKVSGTSPSYVGLYAMASTATLLDSSVVDSVPANFPEVAQPTGFVKGMVEMDVLMDHLRIVERAGWVAPENRPDLVPIAEAGRLADLFRVLNEGAYVKRKSASFAEMMRTSQEQTDLLEELLAAEQLDSAKLSSQLKLIATSCKDCHTQHRDTEEPGFD